jgi:hypothetical protein
MTQKDWLFLSIFTFLIVAVWVTFEVYHSYTTSTITEVDKQLLEPITPSFDHKTIIKLIEEN